MAFVRWVFYDSTGTVQYSGTQEGSFRHVPAEDVARAMGCEGAACMEWREKYPEIEAAFAPQDADGNPRMVEVSVDVSKEEPQLVFTYTPVEDAPEGDDPYAIIDILTGGGA